MTESVRVEGTRVELRPEDFVAAGGQGRVFARGDTAFKIFDDATAVPPRDKLLALQSLAGPHVAAPLAHITSLSHERVGYTMPFFRGARSWGQLCTPAQRQRTGLDDRAALGLVQSLAAALAAVHRHGARVVDLSENNVLVRGSSVCLIDLDSWQTPDHPATALTPSIRSPHAPAGQFDASTDWFAFAVLTCMLLLGIHPFKGKHPSARGLAARMKARISVFDPAVRLPAVCRSPSSLPPSLAGWLRGVLEQGEGIPPPLGHLPSPTSAVAKPVGGRLYPDPIVAVLVDGNRAFVTTRTAAFEDEQCWHDDGRPLLGLGRTADGEPFVVQASASQGLEVRVRSSEVRTPLGFDADDLVCFDGHVFIRNRGRLLALDVRRLGRRTVLLTREVARVLPHATALLPGVAVQNVLGTWRASLLAHARGTPQLSLPNLGGSEVLDARRAGDRLVVLTQHHGGISRHTFALSPAGSIRDYTRHDDVDPWGTCFVRVGQLYVEVGEKGIRRCFEGSAEPWQPLQTPQGAVALHTDGRRVLASAGRVLTELHDLMPRPSTRLGFDATAS